MCLLTILVGLAGQHSICPGEWVDVDTPASGCTARSERDGAALELVFSDEFERDGRSFLDGHDSRWTGLNSAPYSNDQVNYYNASKAMTRGGLLEIWSTNEDVSFITNGTLKTRHLQTAMLQTWNKFCFQQGAIEVSAKMPGNTSSQVGLWPAFWLMGNLGRATFERSTDGFWPYIFDECVPPDSPDCDANQCRSQKVSACEAEPGFGFNPFQGRGAPEIDVIEVQPGTFVQIYGANRAPCKQPPDEASMAALRMPQPFVSTSLQAAPGIARGADQRPLRGCRPFQYADADGTLHDEWLPELQIFTYGTAYNATPFHVGANYEFWGDEYEGYMNHNGMQTDAYSANTALSDAYWHGQHLWRVEWRAGVGGFMRWSLDGLVQFELEASMLHAPRAVTFHENDGTDGFGHARRDGTRRPLEMPIEPMYVILNVDSSPKWGWPSHKPPSQHGDCDYPCECCYDCRRLECTRCMKVDFYTGEYTNVRSWLADLCDTLPASYQVDYVRVWQLPGRRATSCDPASHPTREWIAAHAADYVFEDMHVPMLPVRAGGGACSASSGGGSEGASSSECHAPHGQCVPLGAGTAGGGLCVCAAPEWTGPECRSQSAGDALRCWGFESAALEGALAFAASAPSAYSSPLSAARLLLGVEPLRGCAPRADADDAFELELHWATMCALRGSALDGGAPSAAEVACALTNASDASNNHTYARCSAFSRLSHVLRAAYEDSRRTACCNGFGRRPADLAPVLSCVYGPTALTALLLTLGLVVSVPAIGTLLARCLRAPQSSRSAAAPSAAPSAGAGARPAGCWGRLCCRLCWGRLCCRCLPHARHASAARAEEAAAARRVDGEANGVDANEAEAREAEARVLARHARLGASLLAQLSPEAKKARRALLWRLAAAVGAQRSNADNQAEHLESLLFSYLGRCDGDAARAIDCMHHALLGAQTRWRMHTSHGGERGADGHSRLDAWMRRHADEQLEEVLLIASDCF